MANIVAKNLTLLYPLSNGPAPIRSKRQAPRNQIRIGRKNYIRALNKLNFEVKSGERIGLIGKNGSGKSTLLRVLGGIYTPTGGYLKTEGQFSALFNLNLGIQPDLTGRENIVIRGLVKGWSRKRIAAEMPSIIEFSELENVIDLPIRSYSAGMRMRLLFAIATSFAAEILLLDEWIGAGDDKFRDKAKQRMNELVDQAGITVVASHNRNLIKKVCDKAMWLNNGEIAALGPVDLVYEQMDAFFDDNEPASPHARPKLVGNAN